MIKKISAIAQLINIRIICLSGNQYNVKIEGTLIEYLLIYNISVFKQTLQFFRFKKNTKTFLLSFPKMKNWFEAVEFLRCLLARIVYANSGITFQLKWKCQTSSNRRMFLQRLKSTDSQKNEFKWSILTIRQLFK